MAIGKDGVLIAAPKENDITDGMLWAMGGIAADAIFNNEVGNVEYAQGFLDGFNALMKELTGKSCSDAMAHNLMSEYFKVIEA